jgi:hypothetical protein
VSGAFHVEQGRGVIGVWEYVGRREVNRLGACAKFRVWLLSGVQAKGVESI